MEPVIARPPLPPGPYLVVGLARSGVAAALALRERGAEVAGRRLGRGAPTRPPSGCAPPASTVHAPDDGRRAAGARRQRHQEPRRAEGGAGDRAPPASAGCRCSASSRPAGGCCRHEFIAVTGSNGKTTTVELIGHLHREAGLPVKVAGNVGTALTALPGTLAPGHDVVAEASSFQLEDTEAFAPEAAVLLNLAEDHLDRHGTFEAYRAAKLEVFARQPNEAVAVAPLGLGVEDLGGCARRVCFGAGPGAELADRAGQLWWDEQPLLAVSELGLRGAHNVQNAMAAAAVCLARGVDADAVRAGAAHASRGLAAPARGGRRPSAASSTSTTPRRPTSPRRWSGSTRSRAACTRSSAAAARAAASPSSCPPSPSAAAPPT